MAGSCRASELKSLRIEDVREYGQIFHVNLPNSCVKPGRSFIINEEFYPLVKKYIKLRPEDDEPIDFFLKYNNGKINRQVMIEV